MTDRTPLQPEGMPRPFGVWSPVVTCAPGRFVFISGLTARDATGAVVGEGDYRAQTTQVCENLKRCVEAAGGSLEDIMSVTVFVVGLAEFKAIHEVRAHYFPKAPPASTMVQVSGLVDPKCLIEINAIAVV